MSCPVFGVASAADVSSLLSLFGALFSKFRVLVLVAFPEVLFFVVHLISVKLWCFAALVVLDVELIFFIVAAAIGCFLFPGEASHVFLPARDVLLRHLFFIVSRYLRCGLDSEFILHALRCCSCFSPVRFSCGSV